MKFTLPLLLKWRTIYSFSDYHHVFFCTKLSHCWGTLLLLEIDALRSQRLMLLGGLLCASLVSLLRTWHVYSHLTSQWPIEISILRRKLRLLEVNSPTNHRWKQAKLRSEHRHLTPRLSLNYYATLYHFYCADSIKNWKKF